MTALPKCQSCGSAMRWGVTVDGARMPLDPEPSNVGNVWIRPDGRLRVLTAGECERARADSRELFTSHHATCPGAGRHRVPRSQMSLGTGLMSARMHVVRFDVALQALNLYLSVAGGWLPVVRRRDGERDRLAWRPAGMPGLEQLVQAWDERADREILIGLPQARRFNGGCGMVSVLVARIEGNEQLARARRFRPLPSLVLAEGSSSRRWLLWPLERPVGYFDAVERNRKIAYALRSAQKYKDPDRVWLPAPGTCLRVDRSRPVPVVCARLTTDTFEADAITRRLKEPPALNAWMDAAAR